MCCWGIVTLRKKTESHRVTCAFPQQHIRFELLKLINPKYLSVCWSFSLINVVVFIIKCNQCKKKPCIETIASVTCCQYEWNIASKGLTIDEWTSALSYKSMHQPKTGDCRRVGRLLKNRDHNFLITLWDKVSHIH